MAGSKPSDDVIAAFAATLSSLPVYLVLEPLPPDPVFNLELLAAYVLALLLPAQVIREPLIR